MSRNGFARQSGSLNCNGIAPLGAVAVRRGEVPHGEGIVEFCYGEVMIGGLTVKQRRVPSSNGIAQ